jgi:hypothetical protein
VNTLYYALGGGLGHLTRARQYDATILAASQFADDPRVTAGRRVVRVAKPEEVRPAIDALAPDRLIVDTFPAGLFGELGSLRIDYVARYLRWQKYLDSVPAIEVQIDDAYVLEDLDPEHELFIQARARHVHRVKCEGRLQAVVSPDIVLIIHSGPAEEIDELIEYARDVCREEGIARPLILCAPRRLHRSDVECVDEYPATDLARRAARIFTGGGFNAMREFGGDPRHRPVPFPRKFDDQFRRVRSQILRFAQD